MIQTSFKQITSLCIFILQQKIMNCNNMKKSFWLGTQASQAVHRKGMLDPFVKGSGTLKSPTQLSKHQCTNINFSASKSILKSIYKQTVFYIFKLKISIANTLRIFLQKSKKPSHIRNCSSDSDYKNTQLGQSLRLFHKREFVDIIFRLLLKFSKVSFQQKNL